MKYGKKEKNANIYTAQDKPSTVENWVKTVLAKIEQLENIPELGRVVPEIENSQFRKLIYAHYRIIYRIEKGQISILTIRYGRQLLPIKKTNQASKSAATLTR